MSKEKKFKDDVDETPVNPKPEPKEKAKLDLTEEVVFISPDGNVIAPADITHFVVNDKGDMTVVTKDGIFTKKA